MIYFFKPYSLEGNLGKAYNDCMSLLPSDNDWACLMDGDTMFLTSDYGKHLQDVINAYQNHNVGIFTCLTNRIGNRDQQYAGQLSQDPNIINHRNIATHLRSQKYLVVRELHNIISGHLMLVQKRVWNACKFSEEGGILAIDNKFSRKVLNKGFKIYLMEGFYIFHYYRLIEGRQYKDHLKVS